MTRSAFLLLAATVGALALPTPAAADPQTPPPACARIRSIDNWKMVDESTAIIETSPRRTYKITFRGPCRGMKSNIFARIEARPLTDLMCLSPGDVMIFGSGEAFPAQRFEFEERCVIQTIAPLSPMPDPVVDR
jgi:hypothetical protein